MSNRGLRKIRHVFEYAGIMTLYGVTRILPYSGISAIAGVGGFFIYLIPQFRKLVSANLEVAFPEKDDREIRDLTKSNLRHTALLALEFFWFKNRGVAADAMVRFDNEATLKMLDELDELNKGGIWIPFHLGNWELQGMRYQRARNPKFAVVVRKMNNLLLDKFVNDGRRSEGTKVIYAKGAVKEMLRALRETFYIGTLIDQNTKARDGGMFVDFFGLPVPASRAPAMFARKMNLPICVSCCVRMKTGFELHVNLLTKGAAEFADDEEFTQAVMREIEGFVRRFPEQYLWLYERWRHIPEDIDEKRRKRYPYYASVVTPRFYDKNAPKPK
ncbi:MAG: lysophospholipid acyltransferase family protein [Victivallales bacterium]|nr:lysophospholipid acyltransferase family protein [Victivallales bacterium]